MPSRLERAQGALFGLALGDAIGWPALFHTHFRLREKRRQFLWATNARASEMRIARIAVPFTHRDPEDLVAPGPTDDTEMALWTATILLENGVRQVQRAAFAESWQSPDARLEVHRSSPSRKSCREPCLTMRSATVCLRERMAIMAS